MLNSGESLDDEERTRRRAERRRAKRKRQKERKKLEREERIEDASEQEEEVAGAVSESDSEEELKEEEEWTAVRPRNKCNPESVPALVTENKSNHQLPYRTSDELRTRMKLNEAHLTFLGPRKEDQDLYFKEPEWDVSSAFVAKAASQIKLKTLKTRATQISRENKENEARSSQRYSEAEKAMEQVLKLDPHCKEASSELFTCRVLHLVELGFEEKQSKQLLEKFITVQAVITSSEAKTLKHTSQLDQSGSCRSLWVGNITVEVTEKDLWDLFKMFGEIESIRVLHERFCAFINFKNANMAAKALEKLQGVELGSSKLVMRYPDRWIQRTLPSMQRTTISLSSNTAGTEQQSSAAIGSRRCVPIDGDKCFYWRTTGCFYGDKCRFKHIPDQQGRDKKP
ncbi:Flowering time control protein FPA [Larimichthys crocea]|uniref:Uncharacterized protein n=1 Tax=Larimichthys crocea TaxID=215358 RepID=A0ACD3RTU5_LARCR|nr:Flowering time control protein FPA [Larimichthys crocea]